jgi:hypothetical protein
MATVQRKKATSRTGDAAPAQLKPRRLKWKLLLLTLVVGCVLLLAAGPTLVVCGPWRDALIGWCLADLRGQVSTGDASLGWFSPLEVSQLAVADPQGQPVLAVSSLQTEKSLLGLLLQPGDLGKVTLNGAQIELVLRDDGSNLEEMLAAWLTTPPPASSRQVGLELDIHDARLAIHDTSSGQQCVIDSLAMHAAVPNKPGQPLEATVNGTIRHNGRSGPLTLKISNTPGQGTGEQQAASSGSLTLNVKEFPLAVCQAIVCRGLPHSKLAGTLAADLTCQWDAGDHGHARRAAAGQVDIAALAVGGPWLAGDRLALDKLTIPCQAVWAGNRLDIRRLQAVCDIGQIKAQGTLLEPEKAITVDSLAGLIAVLDGSSGNLSGNIDLAKLANLLPRAVGLKKGLRLTAGSLAWQLNGQDSGGSPSYSGTIDASKLVAQHEGRQLTWDSPLHASFAAHGQGAATVLDQLECQADFVQVSGQGNSRQLQLSGKFDLGRLDEQLGQFIDFGANRIDGQGTFSANYQRDAATAFSAAAQFNLDQLQLMAGGKPWVDQPWAVQAQLKGQLPAGKAWQIDAADLNAQLGSDQAEVKLTHGISGPMAACQVPLTARIAGSAASWLARLQACTGALPDYAAAGQIELQLAATCSPDAIKVDSALLTSQPLEVRGPLFAMEEAEARVEASGALDLGQQRAAGWKARLQTTSFSADLADGTLAWAAGQPGASGTLAFAGDLSRLQNALGLAAGYWRLGGNINGKGSLRQSGARSSIDASATIDNLIASPARGQVVAGGKVELTLKGDYDNAADVLRLAACNVASADIVLAAAGTIQHAATRPNLDLKGRYEYDLAVLTALLQPKFGSNIQLTGREAREFRLQGPLIAAANADGTAPDAPAANGGVTAHAHSPAALLSGQASLGWQAASLYGFNLGPTALEAQLAGGMLRLVPAQLPVNGGSVNLGGQVQPLSAAGVFTLQPGVVVDHVQITEKLGHPGLMFVLPMASRSQVQGQVSVAIGNCQVPLANPQAGDVSGQLTIHELELIRGPFMQELSGLLDRNEPAQLAQNSVVPFRMVQGRIYHEGLQLKLHEITVRTYGSVGLDQSLAIMAEVPLPLHWLPEGAATDALKQKTIHVPIGGTLAKPQIDRGEVERLAGQAVREASEAVLRNGIAKPLERLLGPLKSQGEN